MSYIVILNTGFETASVILSADDKIIAEAHNISQRDHASFLQPAIQKVLSLAEVSINSVDAISVVNGPGSYTGLRVGLSSAKALCYSLNKPLILLNSLDVKALALKLQSPVKDEHTFFCPMIDARRMEVFTALYNYELKPVKNYSAEIIDENFLKDYQKNKSVVVVGGTGSKKLQEVISSKNFVYINEIFLSEPATRLSYKAFQEKKFSDVAYSEPFYLKEVYFKK